MNQPTQKTEAELLADLKRWTASPEGQKILAKIRAKV